MLEVTAGETQSEVILTISRCWCFSCEDVLHQCAADSPLDSQKHELTQSVLSLSPPTCSLSFSCPTIPQDSTAISVCVFLFFYLSGVLSDLFSEWGHVTDGGCPIRGSESWKVTLRKAPSHLVTVANPYFFSLHTFTMIMVQINHQNS